VGLVFSAGAAGPPPLPSFPWHTAQYSLNISWPEAGDVGTVDTFLMDFSDAAAPNATIASTAIEITDRDIGNPFLFGLGARISRASGELT
jgi:hypothetical protein